MRTILVLFIYILFAVLLVPILLFCYLIRCDQLIISIGKRALRLGQKILGIQVEVSGVEEIDKKIPYIFMPNHLSLIDGPMLFMLIPQAVRVIIKKEVFKVPIIGQAMRQVGFIPVDRKALKGGKASIDHASKMIIEKGFSFLIFPEGTRSRDGKLQPFKRGGFFLALASQVPVVPVSIEGSYELMPKGAFFAKKGKIEVTFHPPVSVQEFDRQSLPRLIDKVRDIVQSGLNKGKPDEVQKSIQIAP
jgi:1-acyl-sn-glycerol-3-phosphate acyltransferase